MCVRESEKKRREGGRSVGKMYTCVAVTSEEENEIGRVRKDRRGRE